MGEFNAYYKGFGMSIWDRFQIWKDRFFVKFIDNQFEETGYSVDESERKANQMAIDGVRRRNADNPKAFTALGD